MADFVPGKAQAAAEWGVYQNNTFEIDNINMSATPKNLPKLDDWAGKMTSFATAIRDNQSSPINTYSVSLVNVIMGCIQRSAALGRKVAVDCSYEIDKTVGKTLNVSSN